jgi:hypothetical protein
LTDVKPVSVKQARNPGLPVDDLKSSRRVRSFEMLSII